MVSGGVVVSVLLCPACGEQALVEPSCGALVCAECEWVGPLPLEAGLAPEDVELGPVVVDDFPVWSPGRVVLFVLVAVAPAFVVAGVVLALIRRVRHG